MAAKGLAEFQRLRKLVGSCSNASADVAPARCISRTFLLGIEFSAFPLLSLCQRLVQ